jgi:hypothetical protein
VSGFSYPICSPWTMIVAQRESTPFTREGSQVRSLARPTINSQVEKLTRQVQAEQSTKMHLDPCKIGAVCPASVLPRAQASP